ncbi:MAG: DUF986 family protein [Holdemanella sp.]|nr:DUF986 family protein [Holdemanella sp.]
MSIFPIMVVGLCVVFAIYTFSEEKKFQDMIKRTGGNVKKMPRTAGEIAFFAILIGACAIMIIICFFLGGELLKTAFLLAIVIVMILTMVNNENRSSRLFYTSKGFFLQEGFISFKRVKNIDTSSRNAIIILRDGTEFKVSRTKAQRIQQVMK